MVPMLLAALGCAGPSDETIVDELRVLAVLADPPEARPGETVLLESLVVDPEGRGYDVMAWSCTRTGEDCAEGAGFGGEAWSGLVAASRPDEAWLPSTYFVPDELGSFVTAEPAPLVQHWTLACEPGICDALDLALDDPDPASAEADALRVTLSDPLAALESLPMVGVSLALRVISVSSRADSARVQNPTVVCRSESGDVDGALEVAAGEQLDLLCAVDGRFDGDGALWGYGTAGRFVGSSQEVDDGDTDKRYSWVAPKQALADPVQIWIVLSDGFGGVGIWEGTVQVQ